MPLAPTPFIPPSWPEVLVGLLGLVIVGIGGSILIASLPISPVLIGLSLTAMSGIGGLAGFFSACRLRIRDLAAFGIRRTTWKWLAFAVAAGVFAFVAKALSILVFIHLTGVDTDVQGIYATGASGGLWTAVLATLFLSVLTPIGEEFLFRGVVTTALLRYGAAIAVVGGALVFALFHGINTAFPAALIVGIIAGDIFRRSGSIWPAVVVHAVVNLPTIPFLLLAHAAQGEGLAAGGGDSTGGSHLGRRRGSLTSLATANPVSIALGPNEVKGSEPGCHA